MYPLIEITRVPIEFELKLTNAKLEYVRGTAEMEVSRDTGGLSVKSRPIKLNIDTYEAQNSLRPTATRSIENAANSGQQAAYTATSTYAQQGKLLLDAKVGMEAFRDFGKDAQSKNVKHTVSIEFLPDPGPEITWDVGELNIRYEMDKLNFDWHTDQTSFEFTPGDIQLTVMQQPELLIKYMGGPLYVPASADPNYEPVDLQA